MRLDRASGHRLSVDGRTVRLAPMEWLVPALTLPVVSAI
jgi:hypothetical protein